MGTGLQKDVSLGFVVYVDQRRTQYCLIMSVLCISGDESSKIGGKPSILVASRGVWTTADLPSFRGRLTLNAMFAAQRPYFFSFYGFSATGGMSRGPV